MSKVVEYVGVVHVVQERVKEAWTQFWASGRSGGGGQEAELERETNFRTKVKAKLERLKEQTVRKINQSAQDEEEQQDFSHIYRPKTRAELVKVSAAVMGIEFSYAAETAFVSPLLLNIGLRHRHMTLMWCLSPLLGLFITPLLGSLSDGCKSSLGRRRPFIILLSVGIILGLILVPNGKKIGLWLGDTYSETSGPPSSLPQLNLTQSDQGNKAGMRTTTTNPPGASDAFSSDSTRITTFLGSDYKNPSAKSESMLALLLNNEARPSLNKLQKSSDLVIDEFWKERKNSKSKLNKKKLDELFKDALWEAEVGAQNETQQEGMSNERNTTTSSEPSQLSAQELELPERQRTEEEYAQDEFKAISEHPWGLVVTVLGTVLLDFDADACQSPSRAYMLDVTIPEDHARGLSTFTIMAGLGGSLGYFLGALNWENTFLGDWFGGHVRAVFTLVLFLFIGCVVTTIRSFREIPTNRTEKKTTPSSIQGGAGKYSKFEDDCEPDRNYGTIETTFTESSTENIADEKEGSGLREAPPIPTVREYIKTIVQLPRSLQWLCLTNFFSWMSLVCYSLYFTDFVGEAVYGGDPKAALGSHKRSLYEDGVRFGCWGMSLYSLSCSIYSFIIERLIQRFGAKRTYICGQLVYSMGMVCMTITRHPVGVIVFSCTAGVMYATLFTMPYLLVARYHASETFDIDCDDLVGRPSQLRGLGTDVAVVSSMVFLAQITQSLTLGSVVAFAGTTTAIILAAALFAACGALAATKVLYLDL